MPSSKAFRVATCLSAPEFLGDDVVSHLFGAAFRQGLSAEVGGHRDPGDHHQHKPKDQGADAGQEDAADRPVRR